MRNKPVGLCEFKTTKKTQANEVLIHIQNPILGCCVLISVFLSQFLAADDLVQAV